MEWIGVEWNGLEWNGKEKFLFSNNQIFFVTTTVLRCVLNALEYNTQAIFGAEIWEKKLFWVNFDEFRIFGN